MSEFAPHFTGVRIYQKIRKKARTFCLNIVEEKRVNTTNTLTNSVCSGGGDDGDDGDDSDDGGDGDDCDG